MSTTTENTETIDPRFSRLSDEQRAALAQYTGDMAALDAELEAMIDRQLSLVKGDSLAGPAFQEFHDAIREQRDLMISLRDALGEAQTMNMIKEKGASLMGAVSGMVGRMRSEGVSKALRDNYASFNLAAIGYSMLLTTARAVGSQDVASAAEKGLAVYANAAQKINQIMPSVVIAELGEQGIPANSNLSQQVTETIDGIWKQTSRAAAA